MWEHLLFQVYSVPCVVNCNVVWYYLKVNISRNCGLTPCVQLLPIIAIMVVAQYSPDENGKTKMFLLIIRHNVLLFV